MQRLLLAAALTLLAACSRKPSPTVFIDPALATLVPADTLLLAGIRMEQLAKTPFWREFVENGRVPAAGEFRKRTGLNPSKDLWEVLIASDGRETVTLLRGKFSEMGMEPKIAREGAQRSSYKGFVLIGDDRNAVLFLNPSTAASGSTRALHNIVDNRDNITGLPAVLNERIKKIPSTNQVWLAASPQGLIPSLDSGTPNMLNNLLRIVRSIQFVSGGLDLRTQFRTTLDLQTPDPQQAERLSGALRGLLGLGRLNVPNQATTVFDGMHVMTEGNVVHFSTDISYSVLESTPGLFGVK